MSSPRGQSVTRLRLTGGVFLLVMALLAWLSVALYQKTFSSAAMVTLYTSDVGNEMHPGAQVMVRGVPVGEVRKVSAEGSGARLLLALQPGALPRLPANVSAMMLPTTLFGERYVDLVLPARPSVRTLADGSVIRQNRSRDALELQSVLNNLLPALSAVQPDKLSLTLTALAQGLSGRGEKLGRTLATLNAYLRNLTPLLPRLDSDIKLLSGLTKTYTQAAPAILAALNDFAATGETIATQRAAFAALLGNLTSTSDNLRAFLDANSANLIRLSADSLPTLRILATYAPEFPCTLRRLAEFVPNMDKVLGAGTKQPGLHAQVVVVPSPGKYVPSANTPVYGDNLGPHCYPVPFPGIALHDGSSPPKKSPPARSARLSAFGPGGVAGSPAEAELVRQLAGLSLGKRPSAVPGWGSLLVAPLFRGTGVEVR